MRKSAKSDKGDSEADKQAAYLRKLKECFEAFDADNSGTIDAAELKEILTREGGGHPLSEADCQEIIDDFDVNHDGVLDFDEFVKAWNFTLKESVQLDEVHAEASVVMERKSLSK